MRIRWKDLVKHNEGDTRRGRGDRIVLFMHLLGEKESIQEVYAVDADQVEDLVEHNEGRKEREG